MDILERYMDNNIFYLNPASISLSSPPNFKFVTVNSIASFSKSKKERDKIKYNQNNVSTLKKKIQIQKDLIIYKCIHMSNFLSSSKSSSN